MILRIQASSAETVDDETPVTFGPETFAWTARLLTTIPCFVKVGDSAVATDEDLYINEFDATFLAVGAGEVISVLGSDAGDEDSIAYVSRVSLSGP